MRHFEKGGHYGKKEPWQNEGKRRAQQKGGRPPKGGQFESYVQRAKINYRCNIVDPKKNRLVAQFAHAIAKNSLQKNLEN